MIVVADQDLVVSALAKEDLGRKRLELRLQMQLESSHMIAIVLPCHKNIAGPHVAPALTVGHTIDLEVE